VKRAFPVLALACLAAFDVLLVAAGLAILLRPAATAPPLSLASPIPARVTSRGPSSDLLSRLSSTRTSVAARRFRPKLPQRYSEPVPERAIAGWAFEAREDEWHPLADAIVRLWRGRNYDVRVDVESQPPLRIMLTLDDGAFEFAALEPGEYTLHVDKQGCGSRTVFCEVPAESSGAKRPGWKFVFGTARVQGTVFDLDGQPMPGIGFVACPAHSDGWCLDAGNATDPDGRFELAGLPADEYELMIGSRPGERFAWPRQRLEFTLGDGEACEVDAGSRLAPTHVSGRIHDAQGAPIRAAGLRLEFELPLVGDEGALRIVIEARVQESGAFETWLPAGSWTPRVCGAAGEALELALQWVSGQAATVDLVVPGVCVSGTLRERGTEMPFDGSERHPVVSICKPGASGANVLHTSPVDDKGHYAVGCVGPGEWELRVGPEWAANQENPLRFTLAPGQGDLQLDVAVRKP